MAWRCKKIARMVSDMRARGVAWQMYRDGRKPFPVFKRAAFLKALDLPVPDPLLISETYIEITPAYWVWREMLTSPEAARQEREADFEARYQAFAQAMNEALGEVTEA